MPKVGFVFSLFSQVPDTDQQKILSHFTHNKIDLFCNSFLIGSQLAKRRAPSWQMYSMIAMELASRISLYYSPICVTTMSNSGPGNSNSSRITALQLNPGYSQAFPVPDSHPRCDPWSKLLSDLLSLLHLSIYPSLTLLRS